MKRLHQLSLLGILLLLCTSALWGQKETSPTLVWSRADGGVRNEYLFFRKEFNLTATPSKAELNLYADARYALYVNEVYVNFGPARSFHAHPYYDTYDLRPYLKPGKNVIAVQALCNGMLTYQLFDYHGAFTTWGEIEAGAERIDLNIEAGWLSRASTGYDKSAPRFSFATGPMEIWDSRSEGDWAAMETATGDWKEPIPITDQKRFGTFSPRPIPHLTQEEITTVQLMGAYARKQDETLYSFRIPTPDQDMAEYNASNRAVGTTWVYSPKQQRVTVGLWWGEHYLNGSKLTPRAEQHRESYRRDYDLDLRQGWNAFTVGYGIIWGSWDFYVGVPKSAGLIFSVDQEQGGEHWMATYGPFPEEGNERVGRLVLSQSPAELQQSDAENWRWHSRTLTAEQPARDLVWKETDWEAPLSLSKDRNGHLVIPPDSRGVVLHYAMVETTLGRLWVEGDFPEGTVIDLGFSEELNAQEEAWLYKRYQIGAALRFVTDGKRRRYTSFKPYGAKYLKLHLSGMRDTIRLKGVGMVRQYYPFKVVGSFQSSKPLLDKIWEAGWRTLRLCAEDTYTDTPFRERGLYAGDMLPETVITAAVSGDLRLAQHSLAVFQDMYREEMLTGKENRHNDFPLITLLTLDYVAKYTGDWWQAEEYFTNYASLLRHHLSKRDEKGLIPAQRVFIEWTDLNKANAAMTAYQALLAESLFTLAEWATRFGRSKEAATFQVAGEDLVKAIETHLRDSTEGKYFDGLQADTIIQAQHLTSSVWPSL
ncbi:MAG: hypothetical protein AAGA62_04425, partial [Bacteroidota bacterium]